ncbi:uncharacterized protein LOC106013411 [Aplysia californica]|uniref:Uncharacterized protein LOC106013411 n=1 Tax=Aplysia californica TaxID=6500 RepID=A0ABM1ABJ0_APLCA|nr:uncharacterized protein LOC106013411 [Aplysia californica]
MWISLGQNFSPLVKKTPFLPLPATDRCDVTGNSSDLLYSMTWTTVGMDNLTTSTTTPFVMTTAESLADDGPQGIEQMYSMSYQWLATVGIVLTLVVGMLGSLCTGLNKPGDVDPRYLISVVDTFLIFLPPSLKRWLSGLGTQFMDEKYKARFPDPQEKKNIMMMDIEVQPPPGDDVTDALMPNGDKTTYFDDVTDALMPNGDKTTYFDDVTDALMPNGDKTAYFDDIKESEVISHTGGNATNNDDVIVINNAAPLSSDSAKKSE